MRFRFVFWQYDGMLKFLFMGCDRVIPGKTSVWTFTVVFTIWKMFLVDLTRKASANPPDLSHQK